MKHARVPALLFGVLVLAACEPGTRAVGKLHGVPVSPARAKPDFRLTDARGQAYDFRERTDGALTLLFFGYTHCPDVCPVHLTNIAAVLERLPMEERERVRVVFVTTDPERDSLPRLRSWLANFSPDFVGLRGTRDEVNRILATLALPPATVESPIAAARTSSDYRVGHAAQVLAFTPDDSLRVMYPFGVRQRDWAEDIPKLLRVGDGRAASP